jgi:threonine/homoserine/homoserine lactone efflux protein
VELSHLIAFNIALLVAIISPGPAFLVAVRTTLNSGRSAGMAIGSGLGLMAATWTLAALLGLDAIFGLFPWAYAVVKTTGALYLIYIAWQMWKGARSPVGGGNVPVSNAFRDGFLINMSNPKSVMFAAAVLVVIFPPDLSPTDTVIIVINHLVVEIAFYALLAYFMSTPAVSQRYLRAKVFLDRGASLVLGTLGIRLLSDR